MYTIECPYCSAINDMTDMLSSNYNEDIFPCDECDMDFLVNVEYEPSFSVSKVYYKNCRKCSCKFNTTNFNDNFCENCVHQALFEFKTCYITKAKGLLEELYPSE